MIARAGTGWQYVLTDLSLILFMVTAAALSQAKDDDGRKSAAPPPSRPAAEARPLSPQSEPLALYHADPGAPPLSQWLRDQSIDARQQLTIVSQYRAGAQAQALTQAETLARQAGEAGLRARIVIEPGQGGTSAMLAYDVPEASLVAR